MIIGGVVSRFYRSAHGQLISSARYGFYLFNARGDVVQRVDASGNVLHNYRFSAFGVEQDQDSNNTNPFRFAGEYYDRETGTIYLRARVFNPRTGRFTQPDPHWNIENMIFGTSPVGMSHGGFRPDIWAIMQSGNLYVGMVNNPIMWVDPSGEFVITAIKAAAVVIVKGVKWVAAKATTTAVVTAPAAPVIHQGAKKLQQAAPAVQRVAPTAQQVAPRVAQIAPRAHQVTPQVQNLIRNAANLNRTGTVMNNVGTRPYIQSTQLIQEIMRAAPPIRDPQTATGLKWVVEGTFNGSRGVFDLVIDPATNTILHFLFSSR